MRLPPADRPRADRRKAAAKPVVRGRATLVQRPAAAVQLAQPPPAKVVAAMADGRNFHRCPRAPLPNLAERVSRPAVRPRRWEARKTAVQTDHRTDRLAVLPMAAATVQVAMARRDAVPTEVATEALVPR